MSELFYKMQQIITNDDSITYYNKQYQETYHSKSGAVEESIKKFVEPAMIKEKSKKGSIKILDICFGLGYNSAAVIDEVLKYNKDCSIEIVGLENDISIIEKIQEVNPKFLSYNFIKSLNQNNLSIKVDNVSVKLLIGDARELITTLKEDFDIIFLDPFSPKKCPELWTESFFKDIKKLEPAHYLFIDLKTKKTTAQHIPKLQKDSLTSSQICGKCHQSIYNTIQGIRNLLSNPHSYHSLFLN